MDRGRFGIPVGQDRLWKTFKAFLSSAYEVHGCKHGMHELHDNQKMAETTVQKLG